MPNVLGAYRQFVGDEMQRAEAKKQSAAKAEREKQLADLKKFQASFKVCQCSSVNAIPIKYSIYKWQGTDIVGPITDAKGHSPYSRQR